MSSKCECVRNGPLILLIIESCLVLRSAQDDKACDATTISKQELIRPSPSCLIFLRSSNHHLNLLFNASDCCRASIEIQERPVTDLNFTAEKYDWSEQLGVEFKWATRKSKKIWSVVYKVRLNDSCGCDALCINDRRFLCKEKRTISSKTALFGCIAMAVCLAFAISLVLLCRRQRARRGSLLPASLSSQQTQVSYSPIRQPYHVQRCGDGEGISHDPSDVVVDDGTRYPTVIAPPNAKAEDAPPPYSRMQVVSTQRHNSLSSIRRSRPEEPPRSNSVSVGSPPPYRA